MNLYNSYLINIAQKIFELIINRQKNTNKYIRIYNIVKYNILELLRLLLIKLSDPLVIYKLKKSKLLLPLSHTLPIYRYEYPLYSSQVARIAKYVKNKYNDLSFIDIGANIGDTVAILRGIEYFPILCIEGDERYYSILKQNSFQWENVYLEKVFISDITTDMYGKYERRGGTVNLIEDKYSIKTISVKRLKDILENYPIFKNAKMIKIDTDGMDCKILRSELELLKHLKSILFFEYDPYFQNIWGNDGIYIFDSLYQIGYEQIMFYENTGEYLLSCSIKYKSILEDLHHFYTGWGGRRYCDICAFHKEDTDLFENIRCKEIEFFKKVGRDRHKMDIDHIPK